MASQLSSMGMVEKTEDNTFRSSDRSKNAPLNPDKERKNGNWTFFSAPNPGSTIM